MERRCRKRRKRIDVPSNRHHKRSRFQPGFTKLVIVCKRNARRTVDPRYNANAFSPKQDFCGLAHCSIPHLLLTFALLPRALLGVVCAASMSCGDKCCSGNSVSNPCASPNAPHTLKNTSRRNPPNPDSSRSRERFETPAREDSSAWVMFLPRRICARRCPASRNASTSVDKTSNFIIPQIWRIMA